MIVFDVDGTLIGGESDDWACFDAAFEEVAGFAFEDGFFERIQEITAQAIVHQALEGLSIDDKRRKERAVCEGYLRRLKAAHHRNPMAFTPTNGASALLRELQVSRIPVAIATGDWRETISFKLLTAGIEIDNIPMVTSSEHYSRHDIIASAVKEAGGNLEQTVYVGDGLWDLRACRILGVRFLGVGHRRDRLKAAGATHVLGDLNPKKFMQAIEEIRR